MTPPPPVDTVTLTNNYITKSRYLESNQTQIKLKIYSASFG